MTDKNNENNNVVQLFPPELQKAIAQRDAFIESLEGDKKKQALDFQVKIQDALSKAGTKENRIAVLQSMMREQVFEMQKAIQKLKDTLQKTQEKSFKGSEETEAKGKKGHLTLV